MPIPSRRHACRAATIAASLLLLVTPLTAQQPSTEQARAILQTRPDLGAELRARIQSSGLTPDQIRGRLVAGGYPADLLDPYLDAATTAAAAAPGADVFAAAGALGISEAPASGPGNPGARDSLRNAPSRRFGMAVFRGQTSQFQPMLAGPVDKNYRLGPGDVLVLILTGDVELSHTVEVNREGFILIPQVGQLFVSGLNLERLENLLFDRLARSYSGIRRGAGATTQFHVTVSRLHINQIFVVGDVALPGSYQLSSAGTILTALYAAGGPTENGSFRRISVRRGDVEIGTLDLYDYLLRGEASRDIRLETGDVVFVPTHGPLVEVRGRVVRPAVYEVSPRETLGSLLRSAGGFDPGASRRRIQINRILPPAQRQPGGRDRSVIDISGDLLESDRMPDFALEAGDLVTVFDVTDRQRNAVTVRGNVWLPGAVALSPGMRLGEAIRQAGGPKSDTYLDQILIARLNPDSSRVQLRSAFADSTGRVTDDLVLREDDEVQVFSRTTFRPLRYVSITGAVGRSGRLPFRDGMTLRDAILEADGLTEDALLTEAEIARLPTDRSGGRLAATVRVPLDSTYLFDRGRDGAYAGPPGLAALARGTAPVQLEAYDNVLILRQPEWELHREVAIGGQVQYPGRYALRTRGEKLSDLVARAGGLTRTAYPDGASFIRRAGNAGRIGLELARALRDSSDRDNLILAAGDSVFVPEYDPVVRVAGAVNAPISVAYMPGKNADWYVRAAGGYERRADRKRVYVAQSNGKVESVTRRFLLPDDVPNPVPGSTVVVPAREPSDKKDAISIFTAIAQVIVGAVTLIIVATR